MVLACAKCKPEQNCELKCCTIPKGDVLCRARCLRLSCELDADCDGDCCVNSTCSSCLLKRFFRTPTTIFETTESNIAVKDEPTNKEDEFDEMGITSSAKNAETKQCSRFNNHCASECCIDGNCVDSSRCTPKEAPRRGGRGGGRRISRGGGGSYSSSNSGGSGGGGWPTWASGVLAGGVVIIVIIIFVLCIKHFVDKYGRF